MDRKEVREWYRLLNEEQNRDNNMLIDFMTETFGEDAGEQMKTIIKEENLIQIDNMNRKLAELENEVDSDELFYSKSEIKEFIIREEDEIWK